MYAVLSESDEDRDRRRLVELITRKGGSISASELVRASRDYADVSAAEVDLDELARAGIGRWEQPPQTGRGAPRARRLVLSTRGVNVYRNPADDSANGNSVYIDTVDAPADDDGDGRERGVI